jgi:hypothetical protein
MLSCVFSELQLQSLLARLVSKKPRPLSCYPPPLLPLSPSLKVLPHTAALSLPYVSAAPPPRSPVVVCVQ